jgi:hypothetical protein
MTLRYQPKAIAAPAIVPAIAICAVPAMRCATLALAAT